MKKPHKWKAGKKLAHKRRERVNLASAMLAAIRILEAELGMR